MAFDNILLRPHVRMCMYIAYIKPIGLLFRNTSHQQVLLPPSSISIAKARENVLNVFVHMRRHASKKELIFRVYCICIGTYAEKKKRSVIISHSIINRSIVVVTREQSKTMANGQGVHVRLIILIILIFCYTRKLIDRVRKEEIYHSLVSS